MSIDTVHNPSWSARVFDYSVRFLLVFLPFSSFISVWFTYGLHIPGTSFIKEFVLAIAIISLCVSFIFHRKNDGLLFKVTYLDSIVFAYIVVGLVVSLWTTGFQGIKFGGRYDYEFLIAFLTLYHGFPLLAKPISYYIKFFLISGGSMLFISGLLKWPLTEDLLLFFGYSGNPSAWDFGWAPPIFHGVDGANVRRFQWLLDGPNTMGAFLILFSGIFAYFTRFRKEWYFVIAIVLIGFIAMIFYTYSRSALIGIVVAYTIVLIFSLKRLYKLYRSQLIAVFVLLIMGIGMITIGYADRAGAIIGRAWSTKGHSERMITGIKRVMAHPLGEGLGSAGPGYRYVVPLPEINEETDRYYIPESWYIQQYIESGVIGGTLFLILMAYIFFALITVHPILWALFAGVWVMNLFLHTFESSVLSLTLFIVVWLFLGHRKSQKNEQ